MTIKNLLKKLTPMDDLRIGIHHGGDAVDWVYRGPSLHVYHILVEYPVYEFYVVDNSLSILISKEDYE